MDEFFQVIEMICEKDPRYKADAYEFIMQALHYTQEKIKRDGHITGRELMEGARKLGIEQFGALAKTVFEHWGVFATDDFGKVVFNLIGHNILSKTESDSIEDFRSLYAFDEAFKDEGKYTLEEQ